MIRWHDRKRRRRTVARSNEDWLRELRGPEGDRALEDLRRYLVEGLHIALRQRRIPQARSIADDFAQEALLKILNGLDSFRGGSRFTTWAFSVAIRVMLTELRRKRWQDVSMEDLAAPGDETLTASSDEGPDRALEQTTATRLLDEVMRRELTERQRTAIYAVMIHEMPLEEVALRLGTNRNALYKLLHDARRRLKNALEARGLSSDDFVHE